MLQLAGTLIIDLGLSLSSASSASLAESNLRTYTEDIPVPKRLNLDEMRAVLGLQFMNSM
jgi:hypothetical protein